jgi:hypothetical protein
VAARDHSGQCPVQYLENIGPAMEQSDWSILVIGPLIYLSRVISMGYFLPEREAKRAEYWPRSFLRVYAPKGSEVHKDAKKKKRKFEANIEPS